MRSDAVEGLTWRKSTYSVGQGACVEMAVRATATHVRDSKNPSGPSLTFPAEAMTVFLRGFVDERA